MTWLKSAAPSLLSAGIVVSAMAVLPSTEMTAAETTLKPVAEFEAIADTTARSSALFEEMGKVLTHPRCANCHPAGDSPLQGMEMKKHQPPVVRGVDTFGASGMRCTTCHGDENFSFGTGNGSIPGHEPWHLAPKSMAWVGKSLGEICRQIKDPERNGGKSLEELVKHNAEDGLVGWGWNPGEGREPAPGSQKQFGELTRAWVDTGAHCP